MANNNNPSFEREMKDVGEMIKEIINSKSMDEAKLSAHRLGEKFSSLSSEGKHKVEQVRDKTQDMIQERPFTAVLIAIGAGALLGLVMRGRH